MLVRRTTAVGAKVLRVRVLGGLFVAGVAVACGSPTSPEKSLEAHIRDYVGSGAIDCGRLTRTAADQEMQAAQLHDPILRRSAPVHSIRSHRLRLRST